MGEHRGQLAAAMKHLRVMSRGTIMRSFDEYVMDGGRAGDDDQSQMAQFPVLRCGPCGAGVL